MSWAHNQDSKVIKMIQNAPSLNIPTKCQDVCEVRRAMIDAWEAHRLFEAILSEAALGAQVVDPKAATVGPVEEAPNLENLSRKSAENPRC